MKVVILGSKIIGMNELISENLTRLDKSIETTILTEGDLTNNVYDGIICVSIYDIYDFGLMIDCNNDRSKCNMMITGAVLKDDTFANINKKSDYSETILWREKIKFKEALSEFIDIISN